jgi:simple sugar transport system substrate-binding protein
VASKPDGIALTISDPVVLREPILRAIASGIPVIAYDLGAGPIKDDLPYLTFLGMDEYQGGYLGAQRLISAGARAGVCINHAPDLAPLRIRCKGFQDAFAEKGLRADLLNSTVDAAQAENDIREYAQSHPDVNAYLTTGLTSALSFYAYLQSAGRQPGEVLHGTFDLDPTIDTNIENGATLFGIDAQPYLQGYEAVFWLTMISRYGFRPALPITATGPRFVDKNNFKSQADPNRPIKLIFVQHALCTWDTYWCVEERGIADAARDFKVDVTIWGPDTFDLNQMAALIDKAIAAAPDGLGVTVPDPKILRDPILRAIHADLPVVAYDTGAGPTKDNLPYSAFFGVNDDAEYQGGYLGALRLISAGAKTGICVNHQVGHVALDARCRGMHDAFAKAGLKSETLDCGGDAEKALSMIQDYARAHPEVNAYLTLGAGDPGAISFYRYLDASGRKPGEILHGTFDLSPAVATAIESGTTLFAVDGQPYLAGYNAVLFLTLRLRQNVWLASPIIPTGPAFVDKSNITLVKQLAGKYR